MKIKITGKNSKKESVSVYIPVLPEELICKMEGRFREYEIIDKGTVKLPSGTVPDVISWESFFPGKILKDENYVYKYQAPKTYHNILSYWKRTGVKVKILITGTPINTYAYVSSYIQTYKGANGSIYYSIELSQAIDISVDKTVVKKGKTSGNSRTSKRDGAKKYTIKKGDTLWDISGKFYKDATKWKKIYTANKSTIEKAAKKHGKKSSSKGHWIYPGTTLKIP